MKVIVLTPGTTHVELVDWDEPTIEKQNQVRMQVLEVGICGTDREETSGGRADAPTGEDRLIIGHEMLGKVLEIGSDVKNFAVGDLAVTTVRRSCNECPACAAGRFDMCYTGNYTERGIKGRHGFEAEFVVDEEEFLIKIPAPIRSIGVLTEPMSVVEKAINEAIALQERRLPNYSPEGKTALIAGLGPIGLLAAIVLRLRGMEVFGMDVVDENTARPEILKELGGKYLDGRSVSPSNLKGPCPQIDFIVEAAGIPKLDFDLISALGINGIYALTGVPKDSPPLNFDGARMMRELVLKNQVIFGSVNAGKTDFTRGVEDLEKALKRWGATIEKLITNRVSRDDFASVLSKHQADEIKVVIEWSK